MRHGIFIRLRSAIALKLREGPARALMALLLLSACKNGDKTPPSAEILSPDSDVYAVADSSLSLQIRLSDNKGLSSVSVQLSNTETGQIIASVTREAEGLADTVRVSLNLGDRYTPGGLYEIRARAFDLEENGGSDYLPVHLSPYPLIRLGAYVVTESAGQHSIFRLDAQHMQTAVLSRAGFKNLAVNGKRQLLVIGSEQYGVEILDPDGLYPLSGGEAANALYLNAVATERDVAAYAYEQSPTLRVAYDGSAYPYANSDYLSPIPDVAVNQRYVYFPFGHQSSLLYRVEPSAGAFRSSAQKETYQEQVYAWGDSLVVCAGTNAGLTRLHVYDIQLNGYEAYDFPGDYAGCAALGDSLYVLSGGNLHLLSYPEGLQSNNVIPGAYLSVGTDESTGEIWLGDNNSISRFYPNGNSAGTPISFGGNVLDIVMRYNK